MSQHKEADDGASEGDGEREVADLELDEGDWLHDEADGGGFEFEDEADAQTQREIDRAERSEHVEEMAHDVATDLLDGPVDGFDADDRADEVVGEYADEHDIEYWDEDDLDAFHLWARENMR